MILKNIGSKIVSVGSAILMPGDSMKITTAQSELSSVKALVRMNFLAIEQELVQQVVREDVAEAPSVAAEPVEEAEADEEQAVAEQAEEEAPEKPAKRTRKKKTAE